MKTLINNNQMSLKASIFTAFLCIVFGANAAAVKFSLSGLSPFTNAGIRFSIAVICIFLWAKYKNKNLKVSFKKLIYLSILSFFFVSQASLFHIGLNLSSVSHGTLIANLLPFFVLILSHFFIPEDKVTPKKAMGVFTGFIGVVILLFDNHDISSDLKTGDMVILAAVICWSCNAVFAKKIIHNFSILQITLYPMMLGIPFFFLLGFLIDSQMIKYINIKIIQAVLFQALVTTTFGFISWNMLLKKYGATSLHSFVFIMPLSGVFFGVLLLGETLTKHLAISGVLIIVGIILVNRG